jgi:translation elongation factor EF-Tu-like GTPase
MSWDSVLKNTWEEEAREFLEEYASDTLDAIDRMALRLQEETEEKTQMVKDMVQRINDNIHLPYESRQDLLMRCKSWLNSIKGVFDYTIGQLKELETTVRNFLQIIKSAPIEIALQGAEGTLTKIPAEFGLPEMDKQKLQDLIDSKQFEGME